jgi:hypothetical protein
MGEQQLMYTVPAMSSVTGIHLYSRNGTYLTNPISLINMFIKQLLFIQVVSSPKKATPSCFMNRLAAYEMEVNIIINRSTVKSEDEYRNRIFDLDYTGTRYRVDV